jgi:hypothetical protein
MCGALLPTQSTLAPAFRADAGKSGAVAPVAVRTASASPSSTPKATCGNAAAISASSAAERGVRARTCRPTRVIGKRARRTRRCARACAPDPKTTSEAGGRRRRNAADPHALRSAVSRLAATMPSTSPESASSAVVATTPAGCRVSSLHAVPTPAMYAGM